jgi:hypothetical protein
VDGLRLGTPQVPQQPSPVPQGTLQQATEEITGQENYQQLAQHIEQTTGEVPTILKLSRKWKGGEAMRKEGHLRCPQCDSMNIFTRTNVTVMNESGTTGHAKPRCFDCGWQEGYTPGERSNWV